MTSPDVPHDAQPARLWVEFLRFIMKFQQVEPLLLMPSPAPQTAIKAGISAEATVDATAQSALLALHVPRPNPPFVSRTPNKAD